MKMINKIFGMLMLAAAATFAVSCSDDDVDTSMSVIKDSQTPQNDLDKWLYANYVKPYNVELRYRWEDNEISMDYILVPPTYQNAVDVVAVIRAKLMLQFAFHRRLCFVGAALILHDRGIVAHHALAGQAHGRGIGQIHAVVIAALLHVRVAHLCRQHAHDAELVGSDLERLAQAVAAKGHAVQIIADDAHLLVVLDIHVLQAASLRDLAICRGMFRAPTKNR